MTTIVLCPRRQNAFTTAMLFGRPVWRRTLDAARAVKPRRVVWAGTAPIDTKGAEGVESIPESRLATIRDDLLFVRADLACASPSTLKRVASAGRVRPAGLFRSAGGEPVAIAAESRALKDAKARSCADVWRRLSPQPVFAPEDDLLVVDSAEAWGRAHRVLRERKVAALVRRGVLVPDPTNVAVAPEVSVGRGTVLAPWVVLDGVTRIGAQCTVGSFSHIVDTTVGSETTILDHCFIRDSRIGKRVTVGPFAHLRPESQVGDGARVGNFVELKKATLGPGAKAPHLSYVGDATVGRNANLGAGTITCNYDGRVKSRTVVGDDAFIGSDVQLVAPVKIGKGAFVAAGSCIVDDVPANALALARSRQIIKRNWAKRRRKS